MSGAAHGDDVSSLFRMNFVKKYTGYSLKEGTEDFKLMERMIEMWVNFASTG